MSAQEQAQLLADEDVSALEAQQLGQEIMERDKDIHKLVGDTLDIQRVAQDIGGLIEEQGHAVEDLSVQIENVAQNIDSGAEEVERARARQRRFRIDLCGWICIVTGVVSGLYVGSLL